MKIKLFTLFFVFLVPMYLMGAEVEQYLSQDAIAALNNADQHQNYRIRYFHRNVEGRDDVVVLMGERHIKEDKDEANRGLQVVKHFAYIGHEASHFNNSLLFNSDFLLKNRHKHISNAGTEALGSTMFHYNEYIENTLAIDISRTVEEFLSDDQAEKKQLKNYINFDQEHAAMIFLGGLFNNYLKYREIDARSLTDPINANSLEYWLTTLSKEPNLLTNENAELVQQAIEQIRQGKKNSSPQIGRSQNKHKLGTRIDLEQGCKASLSDNICTTLNTVWTYGELFTISTLATWYMTGSSYAGVCTGIGLCLFGLDMSYVLLNKYSFLDARYSRYYYSLGVDTRDRVLAENIDKFFAKQKDTPRASRYDGAPSCTWRSNPPLKLLWV